MENATKALLIAAGIMVAIMILSLLMIGYNQISDYYAEKDSIEATEQLTKFNESFENFNRKNIRGTDLITLMNKISDYNERYSYADEKKYKRIKVNIEIDANGVNNVWRNNFMYSSTDTPIITPNSRITNTVADTASINQKRNADKNLIVVTNIEETLKNNNPSLNLTTTKLQKLTSNISNLILDTNDTSTNISQAEIKNRLKRADLIKDILGITINFSNSEKAIADNASQNIIDNLKLIARQYYQFTQFKRAYFDCIEVKYDSDGGRISEMNFKIQLNGNTVVFN